MNVQSRQSVEQVTISDGPSGLKQVGAGGGCELTQGGADGGCSVSADDSMPQECCWLYLTRTLLLR